MRISLYLCYDMILSKGPKATCLLISRILFTKLTVEEIDAHKTVRLLQLYYII